MKLIRNQGSSWAPHSATRASLSSALDCIHSRGQMARGLRITGALHEHCCPCFALFALFRGGRLCAGCFKIHGHKTNNSGACDVRGRRRPDHAAIVMSAAAAAVLHGQGMRNVSGHITRAPIAAEERAAG
jgi:hypothetical protein